ncbi:MAG: hypothetical protein ACOYUZ_06665 [Patescibacteria group bacterium]
MSKEDKRAAIALFAICLAASWSWIVHRLHPLSFSISLFSLVITAISFVAMWLIVQHLAKDNYDWVKIGIFTQPVTEAKNAPTLPLHLQGIFDCNFIATLIVSDGIREKPGIITVLITVCVAVAIAVKWTRFLMSPQRSKLQSP